VITAEEVSDFAARWSGEHPGHAWLRGSTFNGLVVVGNLTVTGVIAGDDEADRLIVAGNVHAKAIDTFGWQCGVCASGRVVADDVLATGHTLITLSAKTKAFFEGEGLWDKDVLIQTRMRHNDEDLGDMAFDDARDGKGELAKAFAPSCSPRTKSSPTCTRS